LRSHHGRFVGGVAGGAVVPVAGAADVGAGSGKDAAGLADAAGSSGANPDWVWDDAVEVECHAPRRNVRTEIKRAKDAIAMPAHDCQ